MTNDLIYGFPREIHEAAQRIIKQDMHCCDSMLISDLLADQLVWIDTFSIDQIENYFDESIAAIEEFLTNQTDIELDHWQDLPFEDLLSLAEEHVFEARPHDIYEWWRVSEFLADELISAGHPVLRNCYGAWWGRCATGQSIIMDGTIQQIMQHHYSR